MSPAPWDAAFPVLFNTWKHHAGALRQRIVETVQSGPEALNRLAAQLVVIGADQMGVYTGAFTPAQIADQVLAKLRESRVLECADYRRWIEETNGYRVLTAEDQSRWVLRMGETNGRFVHMHPGRWSPQTRRVRANVLKTALMILAHTAIQGGDPADIALVNRVRQNYLHLCLVPRVNLGLGEWLSLLRSPTC